MSDLALGVRLALRGTRTRVAVTALALAFVVAFLLAVLGALPARQAKLDRIAARQPVPAGALAAPAGAARPDAVRLSGLYSTWRGRTVGGWQVVDAQPGQLRPPGVTRLPRPGELVVSPALADVLRSRYGGELAPRLPGRVVGTVGRAGLSGPTELLAYVGVQAPSTRYPPEEVVGFGLRSRPAPVPQDLRVAAQLGAVGLLLPVLVLVATATRLSAGARDRRLAAVRLVGGSPRQVRLLVAGEALVVGALGTALGVAVFVALRPLAAALVPVDGGVFAADLRPPLDRLLAALVVVPVLSLLVALLAMRAVVVDPLGVRRRTRHRRVPGWWRLVPLAAGLVLLGALWLRQRDLAGTDVALLLGGGTLTVVGLAVVAPALSRLAGGALVALPGTAGRLAGRRLLADPSATARTLTGTVLVVFVGTWLLAFLPVLQVSQGSEARSLARLLPGSTLTLHTGSAAPPPVEALRRDPGVRQVTVIGTATLVPAGVRSVDQAAEQGRLTQVAVVRCTDLAALLGSRVRCGTGLVHQVEQVPGTAYGTVGAAPLQADTGAGLTAVRLPAATGSLDLGADGLALVQAGTVVDPSLLPAPARAVLGALLVVRTDGRAATTERLRNVLQAAGVFGAQTLDEQRAQEERVVRGYDRAARLGLGLAVLVGAVGLMVTSVDALRSRRRDLAALAALGVPLRVLRSALLLEVTAPLVLCTAVALGCGAFAAAAYLSADTYYRDLVGLPWAAWGGVAAAAVAAVVVVTGATLPLARAAARPQHLRTE